MLSQLSAPRQPTTSAYLSYPTAFTEAWPPLSDAASQVSKQVSISPPELANLSLCAPRLHRFAA